MEEWRWACRQKNQSLNFLRMSARVDATSSRVQSALTTKKVTKSMEGVVKVSQPPFFFFMCSVLSIWVSRIWIRNYLYGSRFSINK
jgi:hypothetical protein